jgi:nicotinamide mononucleotide adenylyltransferase
VHLGHQAVLHALCRQYEHVLIGVGSANVQDYRNPFTVQETLDMLHLSLAPLDNYTLLPVDDFPNDEDWCDLIIEQFGMVTDFFSANPFVRSLLTPAFAVHHPAALLSPHEKIRVSGTQVRRLMARGQAIDGLLAPPVNEYIAAHRLDSRFRQQFGLHTLALETIIVS